MCIYIYRERERYIDIYENRPFGPWSWCCLWAGRAPAGRYVYIYIYIYVYTYIHIYIYIYMCLLIDMYICIYMYSIIHVDTNMLRIGVRPRCATPSGSCIVVARPENELV